jgi:integrase
VGISIGTSNKKAVACKMFCKYLVAAGVLEKNPLDGLKLLNAAIDKRHERRVMTEDEISRLISTTRERDPERALLYEFALGTGLRANEIRTLVASNFSLGINPTVTVEAQYAKSRRKDVLPLRQDLAAKLQSHMANKMPEAPVFEMPCRTALARAMRTDLERANIPYEVNGKKADFHSLRHSYASRLLAANVPAILVRDLMRHSSLAITDIYAHANMDQMREAVNGKVGVA